MVVTVTVDDRNADLFTSNSMLTDGFLISTEEASKLAFVYVVGCSYLWDCDSDYLMA